MGTFSRSFLHHTLLSIFHLVCYHKNAMRKVGKKSKHKGIERHSRRGKPKPNRQYKDSVFVDLFSIDEQTRDEAVISFYNALHDKKITNKEQIHFIRLKNVLFREIRNDVSFIVNNRLLVLLEHQSTINPNMSFRFLEYVLALYKMYVEEKDKFLQSPLSLFAPEFYVIYNGKDAYPARKELRLSSLFKDSEKAPQLELIVTVININHPDNKDFLLDCSFLNGYKRLVDKVESYLLLYGEDGFSKAIEECIKEGILVEYLKRKTKEVRKMFSAEYSYSLQLEASREDGRREGREEEKSIIARSLVNMGVSLDKISKATGLSEEKIASL